MTRHVAVAAILLAPAAAVAQVCRPVHYGQPVVYHQTSYPTYHQPQAYHAPAFYPDQKVVAGEIAVAPLVVTVPVTSQAVPIESYGVGHYYSVQEAYQRKAELREILREEVREYLAKAVAQQPQAAPAPAQPPANYLTQPPPAAQPQPQQARPQPPAADEPADLGPDTTTPKALQDEVIAAYAANRCLGCHAGSAVKGNFRLVIDTPQGRLLAKHSDGRNWKNYGLVSSGIMPPEARTDPSKAMNQQHLTAVLKYTAQGL